MLVERRRGQQWELEQLALSSQGSIEEQQAQLRMIGQAELLGDPAKLVSQFTPGQPLQVSFSVDVWPTLQLEPGSARGLKFAMRRPVFEEDKYEAAKLELQQRFASPEGELPALDGRSVDGSTKLTVPAEAIAFVVMEEIADGISGC